MAITELQREKRLQSLGASDIPTILGLNPFQSAADLWLVKTGQVEPGDMSEAAEIGNALEAGIAPLCETRMGVKLVKPTGTFHAANGVMTANVDRMVGKAARGSPIVEMKTTGMAEEWADGVPSRVCVQIAAQFICTESHAATVAVLLGRFGFKLELHEVSMDEDGMIDLCRVVEDRACEWWENHVVKGDAPQDTPSMDFLKIRRRESGKSVPISSLLCKEFEAARKAAAQAEKLADECKARLIAALGDAEVGEGDGWSAKYTAVNTKRFDTDGFKTAHPDLAAQFVKESSYRKLTVKEAK